MISSMEIWCSSQVAWEAERQRMLSTLPKTSLQKKIIPLFLSILPIPLRAKERLIQLAAGAFRQERRKGKQMLESTC